MKIIRVLNTNAVVSLDPCGREIIITGAGIGFKKKKGEELDKSRVEKIYCLKSAEDNYRLQQVVREISEKEGERYPLCDIDRSHQFRCGEIPERN